LDLNFKVDGQMLACTNMQEIITDSVKYIFANFTFSSDWDGRGKTAEFKNSNIDQSYANPIVDNRCEVPHEVMTASGKLTVCVKGVTTIDGSESIIHTKMRTPLKLRLSDKTDCVNSQPPTPTELEQLESAVGQVQTAVTQVQTDFGNHLTDADNPHATTKTQVGLSNVTNDKQVKGLSSGTTSGNLVEFGADGYTVADSGESVATLKSDITANTTNITSLNEDVVAHENSITGLETNVSTLQTITSKKGNRELLWSSDVGVGAGNAINFDTTKYDIYEMLLNTGAVVKGVIFRSVTPNKMQGSCGAILYNGSSYIPGVATFLADSYDDHLWLFECSEWTFSGGNYPRTVTRIWGIDSM
jgi:prefoldin subunit 5